MQDIGVIGASGMGVVGTLAATYMGYKAIDSTMKHTYGKGMKKKSMKKGKSMSIYDMY